MRINTLLRVFGCYVCLHFLFIGIAKKTEIVKVYGRIIIQIVVEDTTIFWPKHMHC